MKLNHFLSAKAGIIFISAFVFIGCEKVSENKSEIIAEVGDKKLTWDMLRENIPSGSSEKDSIEWVRNLVQQWVDQEVLFQNAEKSGLLNQNEVQTELDKIKRRYVGSLVREKLLSFSVNDVSEDEIESYYKTHLDEFINIRPLYRVAYLHVPDIKDGEIISRDFRGLSDWKKMTTAYNLLNEEATDSLGKVVDEAGLLTLLDTKSVRQISLLKKNQLVSFEVSSVDDKPIGLLIMLLDYYPKDSALPLEFVSQNIKNRLVVTHQKAELEQKIDSLKKTTNIKVYLKN